MFGIGMGPSKQEKKQYGNLNALAGFGSSHGQNDISTVEQFLQGIMSGDPAKISKLLGPQMSALKKQGQEKKETAAQFGNRSGGTNAALQQTDDSVTAAINSMIDNLASGAIGELGSLGTGLMGMGELGYAQLFDEANTMQKQEQARWGDIFKSISDIAGVAGEFFPAGSMGDKIFSGISGATSGG